MVTLDIKPLTNEAESKIEKHGSTMRCGPPKDRVMFAQTRTDGFWRFCCSQKTKQWLWLHTSQYDFGVDDCKEAAQLPTPKKIKFIGSFKTKPKRKLKYSKGDGKYPHCVWTESGEKLPAKVLKNRARVVVNGKEETWTIRDVVQF